MIPIVEYSSGAELRQKLIEAGAIVPLGHQRDRIAADKPCLPIDPRTRAAAERRPEARTTAADERSRTWRT